MDFLVHYEGKFIMSFHSRILLIYKPANVHSRNITKIRKYVGVDEIVNNSI